MVRKSVLLPLLFAALLLVVVPLGLVVVPLVLDLPCPGAEDEGGLGSSPAPSPGSGSGEEAAAASVCLRWFFAVLAFNCVVGIVTGEAFTYCYNWLVDSDEEAADEAAKKAGYVAIAGDLEAAGGGRK